MTRTADLLSRFIARLAHEAWVSRWIWVGSIALWAAGLYVLHVSSDLFAGMAAALASVALALRANMLKPGVTSWRDAPTRVWLTLWLLSVAYAVAAYSILAGEGKASGREVAVYAASAVSSWVMLVNLARQHKDESQGLFDGDPRG